MTGNYRKQDKEDEKYLDWVKSTYMKKAISYPILYDKNGGNAIKFKASSLPLTILLDDQSRIIEYRIGIKGAKIVMDRIRKEISIDNLK